MLTFNTMLRTVELEPAEVRLVRHTKLDRALYDAAMRAAPEFERWQEHQTDRDVIAQFRRARCLASFVVDPRTRETIFIGLWERAGEREPTVDDAEFPAMRSDSVFFRTRRLDALAEYRGRLIVDWGSGARSWVQRADNKERAILELRRNVQDPPFPGYGSLLVSLADVGMLPVTWVEPLRHARGIYLLVRADTGEQYVGAATGADGFYGRWLSYSDGHGGNAAMKQLGAGAAEYTATILEVAGSESTEADILRRESLWKTKLGTRASGLNRN